MGGANEFDKWWNADFARHPHMSGSRGLAKIAWEASRNVALRDAVEASKEPIAQIIYDNWYKNDWPVTSHAHQKVQGAVERAIRLLKEV